MKVVVAVTKCDQMNTMDPPPHIHVFPATNATRPEEFAKAVLWTMIASRPFRRQDLLRPTPPRVAGYSMTSFESRDLP